jgi:hypothetical protein
VREEIVAHAIENLRAALARERDEENLLRTENASVAMSLEHGKHQLDTMHHDESDRFITRPFAISSRQA